LLAPLALVALSLVAAAGQPEPWPGRVRVQGPESTGDFPKWDPALTEGSAGFDRELAWDAAVGLQTQRGAWYQRVAGLRVLRGLKTVDAEGLEADRLHVETFFRDRGWNQAAVSIRREEGGLDGVEDIFFIVEAGPREGDVPIAPDVPRQPSGWQVDPVFSALGRGTALSVYFGVHGDWLDDTELPDQLEVHGEMGLRAFSEPSSDVILGHNIGPWTDGHIEFSEGLGEDTAMFTSLAVRTNLWPTVGEGGPEGSIGLRWGRFKPITGDLALRFGRWMSWHWPGQQARYEPWFDLADPLSPDQTTFLIAYSFARIDLTLVADSTDREILPRRGARLEVKATPIGVAHSTPFFRAEVDARGFVPLGSQRWVWGLRGRGGALGVENRKDKGLLGERFFLGAIDMRPWGRRKVMTPDYPGDPFDLRPGGDWVTYANTDLTWHMHRDLALIAFVDTGRVWESFEDIVLRDFLLDAGGSLSLRIFGSSLRLDLAGRPTLQPTDTGHFGIQLWLNVPW